MFLVLIEFWFVGNDGTPVPRGLTHKWSFVFSSQLTDHKITYTFLSYISNIAYRNVVLVLIPTCRRWNDPSLLWLMKGFFQNVYTTL